MAWLGPAKWKVMCTLCWPSIRATTPTSWWPLAAAFSHADSLDGDGVHLEVRARVGALLWAPLLCAKAGRLS